MKQKQWLTFWTNFVVSTVRIQGIAMRINKTTNYSCQERKVEATDTSRRKDVRRKKRQKKQEKTQQKGNKLMFFSIFKVIAGTLSTQVKKNWIYSTHSTFGLHIQWFNLELPH